MQEIFSHIPLMSILLPLLAAGGIGCLRDRDKTAVWLLVAVCAAEMGFFGLMALEVLGGGIYRSGEFCFSPIISLYLRVDQVSVIFGGTCALLWAMSAVFSVEYIKYVCNPNRYLVCLSLCLGLVAGLSMSGNLITLFVFYELLTLGAYLLILHEETDKSRRAANKYIIYALASDAVVLFAVFLAIHATGDTALSKPGLFPAGSESPHILPLFILGVLGFGIKAALMPLHGWLPDAHSEAPAPVSALLSGCLVNVGAYGLIRINYNIIGVSALQESGIAGWLLWPAMLTILLSSALAFAQRRLKRMLAYSTIDQLAYILLGIALVTKPALTGSLLHLVYHALMKGTLFLCAGVFAIYSGKHEVNELSGLGRRMPLVGVSCGLCALGMVGVPPTSGFITKWLLCTGAFAAHTPGAAAMVLLGSLLSATYFLPLIYVLFFQPGEADARPGISLPWPAVVPIAVGAALTLVLGLLANLPGFPLEMARSAVTVLIP